jgi:hypothetical protein
MASLPAPNASSSPLTTNPGNAIKRERDGSTLTTKPATAIKRERDDSTLADPQPDRKRAKLSRKECIIWQVYLNFSWSATKQ